MIHFINYRGGQRLAAAVLLGLPPTAATQPPRLPIEPRPILLPDQTPRDFVLTSAARRAIQKDERLGALNLGISVNNRVATVWGNVPTAETNTRLDETLKKISGIAAVMSECRLVPDDPVPNAIADAVKKNRDKGDDPNTSAKFSEPPQPPATMTGRTVSKPNLEELAPKPRGDVNENAPGAPLLPPPPTVVLHAPIPVSSIDDLNDWEMVRKSEPRFREVTLDVRNGVIRINGLVVKTKDAWDLADKLNALPNIKQVILGNVTEK